MRNLLLILMACTLATGCSHMAHKAIAAKDVAELNNQAIVLTSLPVPHFTALTYNRYPAKWVAINDELISDNGVVDPAISLGATLATSLASAHGARILPKRVAVTGADGGEIADAARPSARYVLDVRTINWMLTYMPLKWYSYGVAYSASARLIDTKTNTIIAQGYCNESFDKTIDPPSYEVMLENRAARLKKELSLHAEACMKIFSTQMSLGSPGPMVQPASPALAQQVRPASTALAKPVQAAAAHVPVAPVAFVAAPLSRPLTAYEVVLAEMRAKHNRLDPESVYYSQDLFYWVMARQAEHMKQGLAAPAALRRAVENMERP